MSTSRPEPAPAEAKPPEAELRARSVLVIGVGGLGCPVSLALASAGVGRLVLCDDDRVDLANLHRQLLFSPPDVGKDKLEVAERVLRARFPSLRVDVIRSRFLPDNARALVRDVDLVVEGADNFATKFLAADACALEKRGIVHGAAIQWRATVLAVGPEGRPCYRCLFEDVPTGDGAPNCDEAGVMGPVVGFCAALMAELALETLTSRGPSAALGSVWSYDGKRDRLHEAPLVARNTCPLCGSSPTISDTNEARYLGEGCAA